MSTKKLFTTNYGIVTVTDVMIDTDGTNLADGVNIHDEDGKLIIEVSGYSCDDFEDEVDIENVILENEE